MHLDKNRFGPMNIKLHTPTTLKNGSGMSSLKQFLLSLVATSISIVLTFGTAAIIDHQKKKASKKEMVMMIISDFDKTIAFMQRADTLLHNCSSAQQDIAVHPEHYDSLKQVFFPALMLMNEIFPKRPRTFSLRASRPSTPLAMSTSSMRFQHSICSVTSTKQECRKISWPKYKRREP